MLLVIAIHNFPEGMAIGVAGNLKIGMSTILGITFHDVPEGFVIGLPQQGVYGKKTVMFNAFLAGFPTVLGALFGWYAIGFGNGVASFSLAVASGAMLALVFSDLLPISFTKNTLLNSGSVLFGIILMKLLTFLD